MLDTMVHALPEKGKTSEAAQRPALQLPPRRAAKTVKMHTISRAEGGQLQAPVGRHRRYQLSG